MSTLDPVETLCRLVAIPSVNPMGTGASGPEFGEAGLTDYLESVFDELKLPHVRHVVHPGRDNLMARLDGQVPCQQGGPLVLFGVHQDTVPVGGMTVDPFTPKIANGRLHGRGACDVKGGMAAVLAAVSRLANERPQSMPTVIVACTVNEEHGFTGARALAQWCRKAPDAFLPRMPDAAIILEPTDLNVVVAHQGVLRWKCHTLGRAAHSARPEAGRNAIYRMAPVLEALDRYHREVLPTTGAHPLCGASTLSVGTIRGGTSVNIVPDRCTIEIDRRLRPGENPDTAYRHLIDYLAKRTNPDNSSERDLPEHDPPYMQGLALPNDRNGPLAERLAQMVEEIAHSCRRVGVPYATDAAFLAAEGIPTVVFGPGSIGQAHTKDEWIALDQLEAAVEILTRFATVPFSTGR